MTLFPHNHMKKWVLHTLGLFKIVLSTLVISWTNIDCHSRKLKNWNFSWSKFSDLITLPIFGIIPS